MSEKNVDESWKDQAEQDKNKLENLTKEQQEQLRKAKTYYGMIKAGRMFIEYVYDDLRKTVDKELDSAKRKRMAKELRKGVIDKELIDFYHFKIDKILAWIKEQEEKIAKENDK